MAAQHVYLAVQRLSLSDTNWSDLKTWLAAWALNMSNPQPSKRYHAATSQDGTIVIGEAEFDGDGISVASFTQQLAAAFGVDAGLVTPVTGYNQYGRFTTFSYLAVNRMRLGLFGQVEGQGWPTWAESGAAARQYIADNFADWGGSL